MIDRDFGIVAIVDAWRVVATAHEQLSPILAMHGFNN